MQRKIRIALAGNPNSGKTTAFNNLTGSHQHVGNYPGVTVEKKTGACVHGDYEIEVIDLPGTYSLTAYSIEEIIARNFIVDEKPDVLVDIVDAANLERNLYLVTQFIELGVPLVIALNMHDVALSRGYRIEVEGLSALLGCPVVPMVGSRNEGTKELLDAVVEVASEARATQPERVRYGREIQDEVTKISAAMSDDEALTSEYSPRWLALKLLENDAEVEKAIRENTSLPDDILATAKNSIRHLTGIFGDDPETIIADRRYGFASGAFRQAVGTTMEHRPTMSDKVDAVLCNRLLGLPIFFALMYLVFQLTFTLGGPPMEWIDSFCGWLGETISHFWPKSSDSMLRSLLVDGIIGGVGGVLAFVPNIVLLFLAISVLEDSGYMARAAFLVDRLMHKIGLHGKSFIPMLIGFGCSVPGIMGTRTLDNRRDRLTTILVLPLMSCSARYPIYALIIPAFFPKHLHAPMLWTIYLTGILVAVVCAKLLRSTFFKGEAAPFVMELPPYLMPTVRGTVTHMWERASLYLKKAGTVILTAAIILWALTTYPRKQVFEEDYEAQIQTAEAAYYRAIDELSAALELPTDSDVLLRAMELERVVEVAQERYFQEEPGHTEAVAKMEAISDELAKEPGYGVVKSFLDMRDAVQDERRKFDEAVMAEHARSGSLKYLGLKKKLDDALDKAEKMDPRAYSAVTTYLDQIRPRLERAVQSARQRKQAERMRHTCAGRVGTALETVLRPLGFDWRVGTALIGALAAKEIFVAQMGIVYAVGEADEGSESLRQKLRQHYTPLIGFCIMLFCLISAPCMATIAVTRRETHSWGWALFQLGGLTALAYVLTLMVYQIGSLFRIGVG